MTDLPLGLGTWFAHVAYVLLVGIGLFVMVNDENLVKKVIGLNVFQTGVFLFFVTSAYRADGRVPLVGGGAEGPFVNPLPHVLILTAIVVGVAVTAVALALVVRVYGEYGTLREDVIREIRTGEAAPVPATGGDAGTDGEEGSA